MERRSTELSCKNKRRVYEGDIVSFCGHKGKVVFDVGCFGVVVEGGIDYDKLQSFMDDNQPECCGNEYSGCMNDNFISLWEIYWNFNCIEDYLWMVEVIQ